MSIVSKGAAMAVLIGTILTSSQVFACSSCGCTLSPEWVSDGYSSKPGWKVDLRYDYLSQKDLREGRHEASTSLPSADEIQDVTRTHMYTAAVDYSPNRDWGFNIEIPMLDRYHTTYAPGDTQTTSSDLNPHLGDVKLVGRYQGFMEDKSLGALLGVKLPTGQFHQKFDGGPAAGDDLDRGLQAGTGTTDAIVGVYNVGPLVGNFDRFEQVTVKAALNSREDFRPGTALNANVGVRYLGFPKAIPQLQLNAKIEGRDRGAQADVPNSGSRVLYASPGLTFELSKKVTTYGFVQIPLYQDYNGLQLAPHYTASAGLRYAF